MFRAALATALLFFTALQVQADIIYLKNGNSIPVDNATVEGEFVYFMIYNGRMAIELSAVDRVEKTDRITAANAAFSGGISGASASIVEYPAGEGGQLGDDLLAAEDEQQNELLQFYIQQKQQIDRDIQFYSQQIQTLRSVTFAKSAIFVDTTEEEAQIKELGDLLSQTQERLEQLLNDARRAGLSPGDLRKIREARFQQASGRARPQVTNPRNANVTWAEPAEDNDRWSDVILKGDTGDDNQ